MKFFFLKVSETWHITLPFSSIQKHFVCHHSLGNLVKMLRWNLGFCTSNKTLADASAACLQTTLEWQGATTHIIIEKCVWVVPYVYICSFLFYLVLVTEFSPKRKDYPHYSTSSFHHSKHIWSHICLGNTHISVAISLTPFPSTTVPLTVANRNTDC